MAAGSAKSTAGRLALAVGLIWVKTNAADAAPPDVTVMNR
jgi:hypothetical protein